MGVVRLYLTGRVAIEGAHLVDQSDLSGRQGRLALVRLVLDRHRPVPVDELADAIWGSDPPSSVDTSLRVLLSRLRSSLQRAAGDDAVIEAQAGCYQLRAPGAWVDVEEAANAIDRAEGAWQSGRPDDAWSHATVAAAIARRPLLPGEDAVWVAEAQGRLRRVHVRALGVLTEVFRQRGAHEVAIATARELIALEPFREASHRALMAAHLAAGDRARAVRSYEACRQLLADELGIDPSTETHELYLASLR